jgi:hypothetical protein
MANKLRCRLGKHKWKTRGRGDALTYFCQFCGTTRDKAAAVPDGCLRASMAAWSTPLATRGRAACAAQCPFEADAIASGSSGSRLRSAVNRRACQEHGVGSLKS